MAKVHPGEPTTAAEAVQLYFQGNLEYAAVAIQLAEEAGADIEQLLRDEVGEDYPIEYFRKDAEDARNKVLMRPLGEEVEDD